MRPTANDALFVDVETFADKEFSLQKMSTRAYVEDSRFDLLTVALASGDDDVLFFHKLGMAGIDSLAEARNMLEHAVAQGRWLVTHNTDFDGLVLKKLWGVSFPHVFDTLGYLRFLGIGGSLANGAVLVGRRKAAAPPFSEESLRDAATLGKLARYNAIDVDVCRAIFSAAVADPTYPDIEFEVVDKNCRENLAGLTIDRSRAGALAETYAARRDEALATLESAFPAFDAAKINSRDTVMAFVEKLSGVKLATTDKRAPDIVTLKAGGSAAGRFLRLRDAVRRWDAQSKRVALIAGGPDRIHGQLRYYGAHTGRFSGGGMNAERMNIQNMPKAGKGDFAELQEIRSIIVTEPDESFISCDLSTIEPRVLAFLAGEHDLVAQFAANLDVYIWFGQGIFPGVEIVKGGTNDSLRQLCKQAVIGLGFGMGKLRFHERLAEEDPAIAPTLSERIFQGYRQKFPRITELRRRCWSAFEAAFNTGLISRVGGCVFQRSSGPEGAGRGVAVMLPTGRPLFYRSIERRMEVNLFGKLEPVYRYADAFLFDPDGSRKTGGAAKKVRSDDGQLRAALLPQTLIENVVQAVARDLLVAQMLEIDREPGLRVRFSVHDELVTSCRRCICPRSNEPCQKGRKVEDLHEPGCPWVRGREVVRRIMSSIPSGFADLAGLPVAAELSDTIREHYGK